MNRRALWWVLVGLCTFEIAWGLMMINDFLGMPWYYDGAREDAIWGVVWGCVFVFLGGWLLVATGFLESRITTGNQAETEEHHG